MSKQAANGVRQQLRLVEGIMARSGAIQAISFVGVGSAGEDIYQVKSENGSAEVRLDLLKDGRIATIALGPERCRPEQVCEWTGGSGRDLGERHQGSCNVQAGRPCLSPRLWR
jgi:hypothetical protein